ncbi:hypothetical protein A3K63_03615 [Candidatus Micrarchaeota archaeon RBG_16_49_10]|nr:MAG: hypothetical protein A3K63_03615 [Candidatus Micrarchaeota archaeon RBG_16_49_10]
MKGKKIKSSKKKETLKLLILCIILLILIVMTILSKYWVIGRTSTPSTSTVPLSSIVGNKSNQIIIITSPQNKTYRQSKLMLNVTCEGGCLWIKDRIDEGPEMTGCTKCYRYAIYNIEFEEGSHEIGVVARGYDGIEYQTKVVFAVFE